MTQYKGNFNLIIFSALSKLSLFSNIEKQVAPEPVILEYKLLVFNLKNSKIIFISKSSFIATDSR